MHRIIALLTFESLVLIAGLFLFAWIKKNEVGKWLQYIAGSVTIFIAVLMVGTVFTCCMHCCGMGGMNRGGWDHHGNYMKYRGCDMDKGGGKGEMNEDCCMMNGEGGGQMFEKKIEIQIDDEELSNDTIEKKVIIKKTR